MFFNLSILFFLSHPINSSRLDKEEKCKGDFWNDKEYCQLCGKDRLEHQDSPPPISQREEKMEDCQACRNYICKCEVKPFLPLSTDWSESLKDIFEGIDFYSIEDSAKKGRLKKVFTDFIHSHTQKVRQEAYEEGHNEGLCERLTITTDRLKKEVRQEERELLRQKIEKLHSDHSKCPLMQTCIGYENAKEDILSALSQEE